MGGQNIRFIIILKIIALPRTSYNVCALLLILRIYITEDHTIERNREYILTYTLHIVLLPPVPSISNSQLGTFLYSNHTFAYQASQSSKMSLCLEPACVASSPHKEHKQRSQVYLLNCTEEQCRNSEYSKAHNGCWGHNYSNYRYFTLKAKYNAHKEFLDREHEKMRECINYISNTMLEQNELHTTGKIQHY